MKEAQWLTTTDLEKMLAFLKTRRMRVRRIRLFAAACCRRAWSEVGEDRCRAAVEALERFADGPGTQPEKKILTAAWNAAKDAVAEVEECSRVFWARRAACCGAEPTDAWWAASGTVNRWLDAVATPPANVTTGPKPPVDREIEVLVHLLRDIAGNPFCPLSFDPALRTPAIRILAEAAYEERVLPSGELDPIRLAVLADALEESGCTCSDLLVHLRSPLPHVRGCHAVDLVLGRE